MQKRSDALDSSPELKDSLKALEASTDLETSEATTNIPEVEKALEWARSGECTRCGKCCTRVATYMQYQPELRDYLEWISMHSGMTVERDKGTDMVWVEFRTKCKYMKIKKGKAYCKVYQQRPKVCQDFPNSPITGRNCPGFIFSPVDPAETP